MKKGVTTQVTPEIFNLRSLANYHAEHSVGRDLTETLSLKVVDRYKTVKLVVVGKSVTVRSNIVRYELVLLSELEVSRGTHYTEASVHLVEAERYAGSSTHLLDQLLNAHEAHVTEGILEFVLVHLHVSFLCFVRFSFSVGDLPYLPLTQTVYTIFEFLSS